MSSAAAPSDCRINAGREPVVLGLGGNQRTRTSLRVPRARGVGGRPSLGGLSLAFRWASLTMHISIARRLEFGRNRESAGSLTRPRSRTRVASRGWGASAAVTPVLGHLTLRRQRAGGAPWQKPDFSILAAPRLQSNRPCGGKAAQ